MTKPANDDTSKVAESRARCPICKAAAVHAYRPFCSNRCADVDLGRWLTGGYAIPASEDDQTEPDEEQTEGTLQRALTGKVAGHD